MRFFNNAGPVNPDDHYTIDLLHRINLDEILELIEQKKYFIIHAPRQTGKTSSLLAVRDYINKENEYYCVYVNVEGGQANRNNIDDGIKTIIESLDNQIFGNEYYNIFEKIKNKFTDIPGTAMLEKILSRFCIEIKKPIILFIDEIDALIGDTLISVLRQLRSGYTNRPLQFPQSIVLCGVRDVRDYRIHSEKEKSIITGGSAFNIKAESIRLGDFSKEEIKELYEQHTNETGQIFQEDIYDYVWKLTEGQPWLVNALAYECCFKIEKDRNKPITKKMFEQAKENIILRRDTHIDTLNDKLKEKKVKKIIQPILFSEGNIEDFDIEDISYVEDMGLIKEKNGKYVISNGIYKEIIPRELTWTKQRSIAVEPCWFIENNKLQVYKLLKNFQDFYRQNSEMWLEKFSYKEAGPHLLLMAFLQRVLNGGGSLHREYALGRGRIDLYVEYNGDKFCIETKVLRDNTTETQGIKQLENYMDKCQADEGHLVIFNRDFKKNWAEKIYTKQYNDKITIWGM